VVLVFTCARWSCNVALVCVDRSCSGDKTEACLLRFAELAHGNTTEFRRRNERVCEIPFTQTLKYQVCPLPYYCIISTVNIYADGLLYENNYFRQGVCVMLGVYFFIYLSAGLSAELHKSYKRILQQFSGKIRLGPS